MDVLFHQTAQNEKDMEDNLKNLSINLEKDLIDNQLETHIKLQQRNGKKCITLVEGLDKFDKEKTNEFMEKMSKQFRKTFNCAATIKKPENIIQLQGDKRDDVRKFLLDKNLVPENRIKTHGF